jgi:CheY-like chemotaxis protein
MCTSLLESLGYRVTASASAPEALQRFCLDPQAYDLLLTDLTMPVLTGEKLAAEIHRYRPKLPIVVFTGFSESLSEADCRQAGIHKVISKPILRHELAAVVRQALDRRRSRSKASA